MPLKGKKIAFLVAEGVEDLEYHAVAMRLQEEGIEVLTAAKDLEPLTGKNGLEVKPDTKIEDLKAADLFGLVLPGGWAPDKVRRQKEAIDLVKKMNEEAKVIGIICHGGSVAVSADIVDGKKATGSLGIKDDLVHAGAEWVDEAAFTEGNLVWGRVVADIPAFNRELVKALIESKSNG